VVTRGQVDSRLQVLVARTLPMLLHSQNHTSYGNLYLDDSSGNKVRRY